MPATGTSVDSEAEPSGKNFRAAATRCRVTRTFVSGAVLGALARGVWSAVRVRAGLLFLDAGTGVFFSVLAAFASAAVTASRNVASSRRAAFTAFRDAFSAFFACL